MGVESRKRKKEHAEVTNTKRGAKKIEQQEAKTTCLAYKESNDAFEVMWLAKRCLEIGDALQMVMQSIGAGNYVYCFCGVEFPTCPKDMGLATVQQRTKCLGFAPTHMGFWELLWGYKVDPQSTH